MAVRVTTPDRGFADHVVHQDADEFAEDNGLLIVSGKDAGIIAIYNRACWDSVGFVPDRDDG